MSLQDEQKEGKRTHIHSSVVKLTSRAKSCRWVTSFSNTNFCLSNAHESGQYSRSGRESRRGAHLGSWQRELIAWTFCVMLSGDMSVKLGSLLCVRARVSRSVRRSRGAGERSRRDNVAHQVDVLCALLESSLDRLADLHMVE